MINDAFVVNDELADLAPEVLKKLEDTETYRRFDFERALLAKMASAALETAGKLSRPGLIKQKHLVYELGRQVLEYANALQFMRAEPSYEEFQAMRISLTS